MDENPYQSPTSVPPRSAGCGRTAVGVLLVALGFYVFARMLWVERLVWSTAFEETRNRTFVLSILGLTMTITGCVLIGRRGSLAAIVAVLGLLAILYFCDCLIQAW
jgi:hypothetical protein